MQAIVRTGGFQYMVEKGATVRVPLLKAAVGADIVLDDVLQVSGDGQSKIGSPKVKGAKVTATVIRHARAPKVKVFKYKRRKGYSKRQGHRQDFTEIRINEISA